MHPPNGTPPRPARLGSRPVLAPDPPVPAAGGSPRHGPSRGVHRPLVAGPAPT